MIIGADPKPGIYYDVADTEYRSDPAPIPSLTQSIAKIILDRSPLHAWHAHPRLNPNYEPDDDKRFDLGSAAHKLLLGRGKEIVTVNADDWRTKAAQSARKDAAEAGRIAVLQKQYDRAHAMVLAAKLQLIERELGHLLDSDAEAVLLWEENGIWCRQMLDLLSKDRRVYCDFKTTDFAVAPHMLPRMLVNAGWDIQGAMAERGLKALDPLGYRRRFLFVVQETEPPYCLSVVELSEAVLTMGRKKLDAAMAIWSRCMREGRWPAYPADIIVPDYPGYAEAQWLEREGTEFASA